MAAQNPLSSAELKELIKLLQVVEGLQESAAQQEANRIASTATARRQLETLRSEYNELTSDISDSLNVFKKLVSELGNASSGVTITTRAYKGIISIAEKLQLHQKSIVDLNEKDLKKLQEKLAIQKQNITNSEEVLKQDKERLADQARFKSYDVDRVKDQIRHLEQVKTRRRLTDLEKEDLKEYRKEQAKLESQFKRINVQLEKTEAYLNEIPGIIQGVDANFNAVEATIKRIQDELKEQNSLLGLGGSIVAGLSTALDKLGFGKLSQALGINQATSEMEEFASKIVKKRSEEANLRSSIERTQQELESKGYSQILHSLEQEKQLEEQIAAARGNLTNDEIRQGLGGIALKNQLDQLDVVKSTISEKDRELHQKAQINAQNKITLGQLTAQNAQYAGMNGHLAVLGKGITTMGSSLFKNLTNPITQVTFVVTQLVDAFKTIDNNAGKLAKGMNISYGEALEVNEQFANIARNSNSTFVTTKKLGESYLAISQNLGANAKIAEKDLDTFTKLREQAGFTNEELIGINKISMATGKSVDDTVTGFMGAGKALAIQKGLSINIKQLMKDTANVSNAIKLSLGATPEALAKAAVKVKELGINLQQADSIANSLLQFESSITAELEAELLTGKEINLENARYYALMGDIGSMAEEINKEIGGSAEFTKMNRIQQEAYAKAVGMSREELANSLVEQEALSKLGRSLTEEEKNAYEFAKQKYGEEKAAKMLGEDQLDTMMDQADVQERFAIAVEKLKDVFVSIVDGPLGSMLSGFATLLSNTALLKGLLVGLGLAMLPMVYNLGAAAISAAALAISAITTASAATLGIGALAIGAGIAVAALAMDSETSKATSRTKSQYTVKDAKIDRKKGPTLVGDFGEVQLDGNDQVYDASKGKAIKVGTDLVRESPLPSSSNPIATSQSITPGIPSSFKELDKLNSSTSSFSSKLTSNSQTQVEELSKLNEENKKLNELRDAREEETIATQTKSSSTQVSLLTKISKILETQLTMQVAKDALSMIPVIGGMLGGLASAGIGGKALYDLNTTPENTPKLAEGGSVLQEGIAKVDKNEIFLGKNSSEVFKDMYVSLNKISDNTTNKLSAAKTLNKVSTTDDLARSTSTFVNNIDELTKSVNVNTNATKLNAVATLDKVNLANLNNIEKASETTKVKEADKTQETGKIKEANIFSKIGETIKNSFADSANIISKITSTDVAKTKTSTADSLDKTIASTLTTSASTFADTANKLNTVTKATTSDLTTMASSSMSDAVRSTNTVDASNKTTVTDLTKSVSSFANDINKSTNTADTANKLSATSTLNKTDLTSSLLNTINKVFVDDIVNSETQKIKEENYLTTNNNLQPTPLSNVPETKLVTAPVTTSNVTTNNNGVSTITNNQTELTALLTKLDQLLQVNKEQTTVQTQLLHKNVNTYIDSRQLATIQNINTSRT